MYRPWRPDTVRRIVLDTVLPVVQPTPLASVRDPFNDPDWLFEPKWDGFRALAYIKGHRCQLVRAAATRLSHGHCYAKNWRTQCVATTR